MNLVLHPQQVSLLPSPLFPHCFKDKFIFWAPQNPHIYFQRFLHSAVSPEIMFQFQRPHLIWSILCGLTLSHIFSFSKDPNVFPIFTPFLVCFREETSVKCTISLPPFAKVSLANECLQGCKEPLNIWFPAACVSIVDGRDSRHLSDRVDGKEKKVTETE